jgi:hypothetical protein
MKAPHKVKSTRQMRNILNPPLEFRWDGRPFHYNDAANILNLENIRARIRDHQRVSSPWYARVGKSFA